MLLRHGHALHYMRKGSQVLKHEAQATARFGEVQNSDRCILILMCQGSVFEV